MVYGLSLGGIALVAVLVLLVTGRHTLDVREPRTTAVSRSMATRGPYFYENE
jgi:hypothetical protein